MVCTLRTAQLAMPMARIVTKKILPAWLVTIPHNHLQGSLARLAAGQARRHAVEQTIVIVITGHRGTEQAVRRALLAAGYVGGYGLAALR